MSKMGDQNSSTGPYCICRSYDDTRFMICCDRCNQWFHGDCVRVKAEEAKRRNHFYCPPCLKANPTLQNPHHRSLASPASPSLSSSTPPTTKGSGDYSEALSSMQSRTEHSTEPSEKRSKLAGANVPNCGNCIGCFRKENCGRCDVCKRGNTEEELCLLRRCVNAGSTPVRTKDVVKDSEEECHVERRKRVGATPRPDAKLKNVSSRRQGGTGGGKVGRPPKQRPRADSPLTTGGTRSSARAYRKFLKEAGVLPDGGDKNRKAEVAAPKQCYGPGCIYASRPQSKYCSDECGMKLAQIRIRELLPSRLQQWYARRPVAEEYEEKRLERIHKEHELGRARLAALDNEERELNAWREKCKTVLNESEGRKGSKSKMEPATSDDPETSVYCFTCGNETSMKNAIKHFSKCFAKYESQTSYGSAFKAVNNLYNIFCDTYNKTNRTYCKRLRVICPEHSKESKVDAYEICGAPLRPDKSMKVADFGTSSVCRLLKKNCMKHYRWLQIRRALIDMERLSQLLRLEELSEETRCIRMAQSSRGNLLALLLHQTVSNEEESSKKEEEGPEKMDEGDGGNEAGHGNDDGNEAGSGNDGGNEAGNGNDCGNGEEKGTTSREGNGREERIEGIEEKGENDAGRIEGEAAREEDKGEGGKRKDEGEEGKRIDEGEKGKRKDEEGGKRKRDEREEGEAKGDDGRTNECIQ